MKLTVLLLTVGFLSAQATVVSQQITLQGKEMEMKTVFQAIKAQTGYVVFYNIKYFQNSKPLTLDVKNIPLDRFMELILKNTSLTFEIKDRNISIKEKSSSSTSTDLPDFLPVKGVVKDTDGKLLSGATIRVKGKAVMTSTDERGSFEVNINAGDVLVVTYTGYQPAEVVLRPDMPLIITLRLIIKDLSEITVSTGYQTIAKERSAGAFAKPDMDIVQNRSGSMNILQRLDGLVPGLTVNNAPSASNNPFLIRGLTTIGIPDIYTPGGYIGTNRNPLYVVDGLPMNDLSSINPQDVEEISVLKDATAASIWGARASNGVIVVTTKKGTRNGKLVIDYDGFTNIQGKPDIGYFNYMNSRQFIQAAKDIFDPVLFPWASVSVPANISSYGIMPHEKILYDASRGLISTAAANAGLDSLAATNNLSQINDLWYRNAVLTNHTISLRGGTNNYGFYGSLAYTNNQDYTPGNSNRTYKLNFRQDFTFNPAIQAYLITDLTNTTTGAARPIQPDSRFLPYVNFRGADGRSLSMPWLFRGDSIRNVYETNSGISLNYNPLDEMNYGYTKSNAFLARITGGVTVKLWKGLRFEGLYALIKGSNRTTAYDDILSYGMRSELVSFTVAPTTAGGKPTYYLPATGGKYGVTHATEQDWTVRNQLVYDQSWKDRKHALTLLAGQETQEQHMITNGSVVRGYDQQLQTSISIDYKALSSGTGVANPVMPNNFGLSIFSSDYYSSAEQQSRFTSYYANAAYTYDRKYTLNGSWRIDGSNLFGKDRSAQNKSVWSAGAAWMLHRESFIENIKWLNRLMLRFTYGLTGNSPSPGTAASYDILNAQVSAVYPSGSGLTISVPANKLLTWESTQTTNVGIDYALLASRIEGSLDLYHKHTSNLIGYMPVNDFTGYSSIAGNQGDLINKGVELRINSRNVILNHFSWNTQLILSYNRNMITHLNQETAIVTAAERIKNAYQEGYSAFSIFAYRFAGLDNLGDPQIHLADKSVTKAPNVAMAGDLIYKGTNQPVWNGGLMNAFHYKMIALNINVVYNFGNVLRKDVNNLYTNGRLAPGTKLATTFSTGNKHAEFASRWKQPGDEATTNIPSYVGSQALSDSRRDIHYYTVGDLNVVSASYIKLRDITLSYHLPAMFISRLHARDISFRCQLSNIMLWKANKDGIDPEFQHIYGTDVGGERFLRTNQNTITFGAHVTL